jgi:hypothetical protein
MKNSGEVMPLRLVHGSFARVIREQCPRCDFSGYICLTDLSRLRSDYVEAMLQVEKGELSALGEDVARGLHEQELLSRDINAQFDERLTFGERVAD